MQGQDGRFAPRQFKAKATLHDDGKFRSRLRSKLEWKPSGWRWLCEAMPSDRIRTGYHDCMVGHSSERRSRMSHYLLASGDLLVIAAIILSVAYLSWKQFSK